MNNESNESVKVNNINKLYKYYIKSLVILVSIFFVLIVLINYTINPYSIFNSYLAQQLTINKPFYSTHTRMGKAYIVRKLKPKSIILGASRAETGLNPEHPGFKNKPVYNLSLAGANIYETYRYFQHMNNLTKLVQIVLSIDFFQFNANKAVTPDFLESRLSISYKGSQVGYPLQEVVSVLSSIDGLVASIETIFKQNNSRQIILNNGQQNHTANKMKIVKQGGHRNAFLQSEEDYIKYIYFPKPAKKFDFSSVETGTDSFLIFRLLIEECYRKDIDTKILISPSHARQWETLAASGLWDKWEFWKKELVRLNEEAAVKYGRKPFALWDFSGYNTYTTESVPPIGDTRTEMKWYWESSHYRSELGDIVLDRIFNVSRPERTVADDFGVLLTAESLNRHLLKIRSTREKYRLSHLNDVAEINDLKNQKK